MKVNKITEKILDLMSDEIKEVNFSGGFDLLREWKLKDYK